MKTTYEIAILCALLVMFAVAQTIDEKDSREFAAAQATPASPVSTDKAARIKAGKEQRAWLIAHHKLVDDSNYMVSPIAQIPVQQ